MLKAIATSSGGKKVLVIGLTFKDLELMRAHPMDDHIRIEGAEIGLAVDVMMFVGPDDAARASAVGGGIGPNTRVHISDKLKN